MNWSSPGPISPAQWAQLLEVDTNPEWSGDDGGVILRRQLDAPLIPDLLIVPGIDSARLEKLVRARSESETFLQHLTSNEPVLEILVTIKSFARHVGHDLSNPLHGNPALIIYFAAIAAAMVNCHANTTTLTEMELRTGLDWALGQARIESLTALMTTALQVNH